LLINRNAITLSKKDYKINKLLLCSFCNTNSSNNIHIKSRETFDIFTVYKNFKKKRKSHKTLRSGDFVELGLRGAGSGIYQDFD
jgi:hypothetical protein